MWIRNVDVDQVKEAVTKKLEGPGRLIERWWKELHERLEKYFKNQLRWLKEHAHYDPSSDMDRFVRTSLLKSKVWNFYSYFCTVVLFTYFQKGLFLFYNLL